LKIEDYFNELGEKSDKSKDVYEIIQYIKNNYNQSDLDLNSISLHIHLTPAYICQIFKKKTEVTINEYLTEYRIEKAKELLRDGNSKLYEVATGIGYRDTNYFIRIFRKKTGVTPSEYREKF
jgi:two-component system response regulator YesN